MRVIIGVVFFVSLLLGTEVSSKVAFSEILSDSLYYIDYNRSATIKNIDSKKFKPINSKVLGFGYSPGFAVWIKFVLTNKSSKKITKIIEYDNPLTSYIDFYDAKSKKLLKSSGMLNKNEDESINPVLKVVLKPHESKTFYIKISSEVTALIAKLYAWNIKEYSKKLKENQNILAAFFGAMGIIILYNSVIYFITRKLPFLYYVAAFIGILIYYLFYQGVAPLLLSKKWISFLNDYIPFIVLLPVLFLSLFTREVLDINRNRQLNNLFMIILGLSIFSSFIFFALGMHNIRNLSYVVLFFMLFGVTGYYLKKNSYAKYLLISWFIFTLTALFMYLENVQVFSLSSVFPYYSEVALIFEALSFSLILAHYIAKLEKTKQEYRREIEYKELIISELDHRVSGLLQFIIYKIRQEESKREIELNSLRQNILAIGEINRLLNITQSFPKVGMQEYLIQLAERLQKIYRQPNINIFIDIDSKIELKPKAAASCAKIMHESITNIYKYAYKNSYGNVIISLKEKNGYYIFIIADNGKGIEKVRKGAKGLLLIKDMAKYELNGTIDIDSSAGVKITIRWQRDE